jgi:hypothetical protein
MQTYTAENSHVRVGKRQDVCHLKKKNFNSYLLYFSLV